MRGLAKAQEKEPVLGGGQAYAPGLLSPLRARGRRLAQAVKRQEMGWDFRKVLTHFWKSDASFWGAP